MSDILSSISGQFGKSWLLGSFLPSLVFVVLCLVFLSPLFPSSITFLSPIEVFGPLWQVFLISLFAMVISGLLYNLNIAIIRFYEGYPWQSSWIGKRRKKHYQAEFDMVQAKWLGIRTLLRKMDKLIAEGHLIAEEEVEGEWSQTGRMVNGEFPRERHHVLPTRLGNVIRSFEEYPIRQYQIEAVTLWPRLIAKIDKDYAASVESAKTSFDFMVNSSVLSGLLAGAILIVGLAYPIDLISPGNLIAWLFEVVGFALLTNLFYLWSISRAKAWGDMVKSTFDLYRWDLLKQLGYTQLPANMIEERLLWQDITQQMIYADSPSVPLPEYAPATTYASCLPRIVKLRVSRGVSSLDPTGAMTIMLSIMNVEEKTRAGRATVTDKLPEGFEFEWGSARIGDDHVSVEGTNPYRFIIGEIEPRQEVILTYRAIKHKS